MKNTVKAVLFSGDGMNVSEELVRKDIVDVISALWDMPDTLCTIGKNITFCLL